MPLPEYDADGKLLRPTGFERWVLVGTSIGLSYSEDRKKDPQNPGQFHNVYLQPQAFDHFVRTGEFPEQTMFVVTNQPSQATQDDDELMRHGFVAAPPTGLEVAVKDTARFDSSWAYFMYDAPEPKPGAGRASENAFAHEACYDCHAAHGAIDNVFVQYYSVLTTMRAQHLAAVEQTAK